jgi:hypothetical protein
LQWFIPRAVALSRIKAVIAPQARACTRLQTSKQASWQERTERQDKKERQAGKNFKATRSQNVSLTKKP